MELFFDLVYVFAVTQLSHLLLQHVTWRGAGQTALLLLAIWWAWIDTTWFTNWFDPNARVVRPPLILIMLASLVMSASVPQAYAGRGGYFAAAYVTMQVGRSLWAVAALREDPPLRRNFQRILCWKSVAGILWLAGGVAQGPARELLWLVGLAIDFTGPVLYFYTPGLGRSTIADWNISGAHLAERFQLFVIIALGESILITGAGASVSDHGFTAAQVLAFVAAFASSVVLWWIYFDRTADDAVARTSAASEQGRLGRSAYTYFHLPIVAGVIVAAVGDELTIDHPTGHANGPIVATVLGGPVLFLAGHLLYKRAIFNHLSISRVVAGALLGVLAAVSSAGVRIPPLALSALATAVVATIAVADAFYHRRHD